MNTLDTDIVANLLGHLHQAAHDANHVHFEQVMAEIQASGEGAEQWAAKLLEDEKAGLRSVYQGYAEHFLSVSPGYGRFLYAMARAGKLPGSSSSVRPWGSRPSIWPRHCATMAAAR